jgi:hypothetical protein
MPLNRASLVTVFALLLSTAGAASQDAKPVREAYTAVASNISELARTGITPLDIVIERWTDAGENERLMTAFEEKGQDGLVAALQKTEPAARIRTPGNLAYEFHYARQVVEKDGTRRILLITDRPISFGELTNRGRSLEYPFALVDFRVDASGRGEGKLFLATKIIRTGDLFVLENFATQPVVLSDITRQK